METIITENQKIVAVQKEFSTMFPFLRLEFYSNPNRGVGSSYTKLMKHISKTIGECRTIHSSGHVSIKPEMTVGELEQGFKDIYGLTVHVFFQSGEEWFETADIDYLTLAKKNLESKKLNNIVGVI